MRVLVLGPFADDGGLARVARQTAGGFEGGRFDIARCETGKDTPEDRSLLAACRSHVRRGKRFVEALRSHRPHVVHIHTCSYGTFYRSLIDAWICRLLRYPYVLHIHGGLFAEFLAGLCGVRRRLVTGGLRRARRVIVLSNAWRTKLMREVAGLKIAVIGNAVENGPAAPPDAARGGGVLFVGDLSEPKRPEDLLVAYAALPRAMRLRFPLRFVGGGTQARRRRLSALAERLGVAEQVQFRGPLPHDQVRALLGEADLLVLPSRAEGMPLTLLEAMQAGLPAVATRVGAVPEMVTDGVEAVLVEPRDVAALARQMKRLLGGDAQRRAMGCAARLRVEQGYSISRFRAQLAEVWQDVAAEGARPALPPVPRLALPTGRYGTSALRSIL